MDVGREKNWAASRHCIQPLMRGHMELVQNSYGDVS